jgi:histidinol-phosphate aminotransferase
MSLQPRPGIDDIQTYVAGESIAPGFQKPAQLASNECPFPPSDLVKKAVANATRQGNRYPDGGSAELRNAIARHHGLKADNILAGSGSEELLQYVCRSFVKDGDEVVYSQYGFMMYPIIARSVGATPIAVPERDFVADVDAILSRVGPRTKLVFLTNPANPAGTYVNRAAMKRLINQLPPDVLLVIDEAYAEFVAAKDFASALSDAKNTENVVVTRTFSKIYGLGGYRVGWALAPTKVVEAVNKIRLPFNVNRVAQAAAVASLADDERIPKVRDYTIDTRTWTVNQLQQLGISAPPSQTNFILPKFTIGSENLAPRVLSHLKLQGVLVRPMTAYGLPDRLRVTIGLKSEMRRFIAGVKEALAENPSTSVRTPAPRRKSA